MSIDKDRPLAKGEPKDRDANRDPISGAPGAHPVGTGLGAAAGGVAAGAAVGTVAGPVGTAIGAAVGAIAGGLAGKGIAEKIDPTVEDTYWREHYASRPYFDAAWTYNDYGPAYRYGWGTFPEHSDRSFDDVEPDLGRGWEQARGQSRLSWDHAKEATRDAWTRVSDATERAVPGDSDRDGR
ncbi:hypothetical protein [Piscinibacter sp.]|uniref:hypothetical protein n=1 Tax=Piscinibacter sp. TaxID=1903157 RepID=UPI002C7FEB6D|nr:hypothetical protein [Albitalea sp.]HUG23529.1 hypothetical protein [Albitalea sp.]